MPQAKKYITFFFFYLRRNETGQVGMMECKMTCNSNGMLWPLPTGKIELSKELIHFYPGNLLIKVSKDTPWNALTLAVQQIDIFKKYLYKMHPRYEPGSGINPFSNSRDMSSENSKKIEVQLVIASGEKRITMETDESYSLDIVDSGKLKIIKFGKKGRKALFN